MSAKKIIEQFMAIGLWDKYSPRADRMKGQVNW